MIGQTTRSIPLELAALATTACLFSADAQSQVFPHEPTDIMIRRMAGLSVDTAKGQIEIIDVGHGALDTMLSIVGNRTDAGWAISYACAMSPHCSPSADHAALTYTLSSASSIEVDRILELLRQGREPDGQAPSANIIGGNLLVSINYKGFKHDYRRAGRWGSTLGRLEALMTAADK